MSKLIRRSNSQPRRYSALLAMLTVFGGSFANAQDAASPTPAPQPEAAPPVEPAGAAPAGAAPAGAAPASQPTAAGDPSGDIAELRAELNALKAKQEDAEATALLAQAEPSAEQAAEPEMIRIYGFTDFGLDKYFMDKNSAFALLRPTAANTFVFGNLNLYFDATPVEHLRTMIEVRFTAAPHGEETALPPIATSYERIDTTAFDFSSPSSQSQLRLGGIYIERAWSEYQFSDLFKVQWGLFLNPFGIWNLDHGSPTLIALMLPTFIASQMVPTRLLGIHVHGSAFFGGNELGYALHVTNGRTPLDFDLSEDKAIGARVYLAHEGGATRLVLGASGYYGTYLNESKQINTMSKTDPTDWIEITNYTEEVLGVDVALDVGDLRVRSEAVARWIVYKNGKSEQTFGTDGSVQYLPNRIEYAAYVMAAYRTPWRLEPYLEAEVSSKSYTLPQWSGDSRASSSNVAALNLSVGLNAELTTHTLLKTQLVWSRSYDRNFENKSIDIPILFIRAVNSF